MVEESSLPILCASEVWAARNVALAADPSSARAFLSRPFSVFMRCPIFSAVLASVSGYFGSLFLSKSGSRILNPRSEFAASGLRQRLGEEPRVEVRFQIRLLPGAMPQSGVLRIPRHAPFCFPRLDHVAGRLHRNEMIIVRVEGPERSEAPKWPGPGFRRASHDRGAAGLHYWCGSV